MTSPSGINESCDREASRFGNALSSGSGPDDIFRSVRVLERLALTLGVPVETFFDHGPRSVTSDEPTAQDVADITQAFTAITDPVMRRYCLDIVRAAGSEKWTGRPLVALKSI